MTVLLVASGGGHLLQLNWLLSRLGVGDDRLWVTFDTALARDLLRDEEVMYADYVKPHDLVGSFGALEMAHRVLKGRKFDYAVSTGANLAVVFLPLARLRGIPVHYIETAARSQSPSLSGRILQRVPGINLYTQHERWLHGRWQYRGSVLEGFDSQDYGEGPVVIRKIVVTVGTNETFGFRRLLERMIAVVPPEVEVIWQTGPTDVTGLAIKARRTIPADDLDDALSEADAVVTHAGTGSALSAMAAGAFPLLVPRRHKFNEHIDDHQVDTANELESMGLCLTREADELTWDDVVATARRRCVHTQDAPAFQLNGLPRATTPSAVTPIDIDLDGAHSRVNRP